MKKKFFAAAVTACVLSAMSATAAFAQGWGQVGNSWFYYYEDGTAAKNTWITTEGGTYWVNNDGKMAADQWVNTDDSWYYMGSEGLFLTNQLWEKDNNIYWLGEDGKMIASAWLTTEDGKTYYFQENGAAVRKGWKMIDGDYYYFLKSGVLAVDALVPGGYRVGPDGKWIQR